MKRGRAVALVSVFALAFASLAGVACQLVAGISMRDFEDPEASVDAATEASDPCVHARPPPKGEDDDPVTELPRLTFVMDTLDFGASDLFGYDLDDDCTCFADPSTKHGGVGSCKPPGQAACDSDGGVDNRLAVALRRTDSLGFLSEINEMKPVRCGSQGLMFQITNYNGLANDSAVKVAPLIGAGVFERHADGLDEARASDAGCEIVDGGYVPVAFDETDLWRVDDTSLIPDTLSPIYVSSGYVTNHKLVVNQLDDIDLLFAGIPLKLATPTFTGTLRALPPGAGGAARFEVVDGLLSGRVATHQIFKALSYLRLSGKEEGAVCDDGTNRDSFGARVYRLVKEEVCKSRDVLVNRAADHALVDGGALPCDALSVAIRFTAKPATVIGRGTFAVADAGCMQPDGAPFRDDCQ